MSSEDRMCIFSAAVVRFPGCWRIFTYTMIMVSLVIDTCLSLQVTVTW